MDLAEEAAEQIKAAKAVVAARFAGAEAAAALASGVGALGLREGEEKRSTSAKAEDEAVKEPTEVKDPKDSAAKEEKAKVAFTKEAVSAAAARRDAPLGDAPLRRNVSFAARRERGFRGREHRAERARWRGG